MSRSRDAIGPETAGEFDELGRFTEPSILILVSLASGPKHGYLMIEDIEQLSGTRLGPGTLYGALTRLEARGLIEPLASSDRRQPYRLTPQGQSALELQVRVLQRVAGAGANRLGIV